MPSRISIIRKQYIERIKSGETLLCGLCGSSLKAKARGDYRIISGGMGTVTVDHIISRSAGGSDRVENLQPAHLKCNNERGDMPVEQYRNMANGFKTI